MIDDALNIQEKSHTGIGPSIASLIAQDIQKRSDYGKEKYGEELKAFNDRDSLVDAYQEALDLAAYLKQSLLEAKSKKILNDLANNKCLQYTFDKPVTVIIEFQASTTIVSLTNIKVIASPEPKVIRFIDENNVIVSYVLSEIKNLLIY